MVEAREDLMFTREEDATFERVVFFLLTRAADENVAGKIKLTEINRKHFAIKGILFVRRIYTTDQAAKISRKPGDESLKFYKKIPESWIVDRESWIDIRYTINDTRIKCVWGIIWPA
jgi:hypothetical protein